MLIDLCETAEEYQRAADAFAASPQVCAASRGVPVLVGGRPDLRDIAARTPEVYGAIATPAEGWQFVLSEGARSVAGLSSMLALLADGPTSGAPQRCTVGIYGEVDYGFSESRGNRNCLIARDACSLTWLVAKQLLVPHNNLPTAVLNGVHDMAMPGVQVQLDSTWLAHNDARARISPHAWDRVLLFGNGHDHISHLGQVALCGQRPGVRAPGIEGPSSGPGHYRPPCALGNGCVKSSALVWPVHTLAAASVTLGNCFSGPDADAATYHADYQLHLAAVDGLAARVIALDSACDAGVPECRAWSASPGDEAMAMNASLAAVNGYAPFFTIGLGPHQGTPFRG